MPHEARRVSTSFGTTGEKISILYADPYRMLIFSVLEWMSVQHNGSTNRSGKCRAGILTDKIDSRTTWTGGGGSRRAWVFRSRNFIHRHVVLLCR